MCLSRTSLCTLHSGLWTLAPPNFERSSSSREKTCVPVWYCIMHNTWYLQSRYNIAMHEHTQCTYKLWWVGTRVPTRVGIAIPWTSTGPSHSLAVPTRDITDKTSLEPWATWAFHGLEPWVLSPTNEVTDVSKLEALQTGTSEAHLGTFLMCLHKRTDSGKFQDKFWPNNNVSHPWEMGLVSVHS